MTKALSRRRNDLRIEAANRLSHHTREQAQVQSAREPASASRYRWDQAQLVMVCQNVIALDDAPVDDQENGFSLLPDPELRQGIGDRRSLRQVECDAIDDSLGSLASQHRVQAYRYFHRAR